ncbi:hypothetical protein B0H15DRAFT_361823 [Mycena belliarum]|uniref:Stealth protein CR3 conserved region 3 domain-containing protein n=1 Tax=Mycena belliarum TaxID=1033014 RepID=A0AAD6U5G8_9AGAR|nr:hypothetical protein B0H15DRAFT_361823 [Mycena belliae]
MRRRTVLLLLALTIVFGASLLWPSPDDPVERYPPPRPYKAKVEPRPKIIVPPKEAKGVVPDGWRAFTPPNSYLLPPYDFEPTLAQRLPCVDQWLSRGKPCEMTEKGRIDAVWTWVNGSEPVLEDTREDAVAMVAATLKPMGSWQPPVLGSRQTHFRTHGEMINSMRSVFSSMPSEVVRKYILLTADVAAEDTAELRLGSVPTWMDTNHSTSLQILHHSDVFRVPRSSLPQIEVEGHGLEWRDRNVPSFNSLAIESQLANIPESAPTILYLNDDSFLLKSVSAADFDSPLYGPVFRIQFDLGVNSRAPGSIRMGVDKEGEWPALEYTNWLLDQRFGKRRRRYLHHVAKVLSAPTLREVAAIWADELATTGETRFRGQGPQVNLVFLTTWYTIEKHRESLLYSFIMLRADANADGVFSTAERQVLTMGLAPEIPVALREDGSLHYVELNLHRAGLDPPKETVYEWLSYDGYPLIKTVRTDAGAHCTMDVDACFAPGTARDVFTRVAFEQPECGDCLIAHLISRSGSEGLSAFLPPPGAPRTPSAPKLPLAKRWQDVDFSAGMGREFAVDNIQRYTYVAGSSPMQFLSLRRPWDTTYLPNKTSPVAFLAVNDDLRDLRDIEQSEPPIRKWYADRWGQVRAWWEKRVD